MKKVFLVFLTKIMLSGFLNINLNFAHKGLSYFIPKTASSNFC